MKRIPYRVNSQNSSVGLWYMTMIGLLTLMYLIFYLIIFIIGDMVPFHPISNSIDYILRIGVVLIYGVPPLSNILRYLEKKFVGDKFSIFEEFEGVYYSKHNSSISFNNYHHNSKHNSINVMRNSHISHNSYNAMRSSYNSAINIVTSNNNSINGCDIVEKKVIEKG
ncbi:9660_t:CDS:1 [Entrophospora sp. SA101]|nr:9655_t:CDS:1 [Entrophospora sp. SA101]CAJ0826992.1 9660_t:CDS:1 [Entrophospora sp. SA101]